MNINRRMSRCSRSRVKRVSIAALVGSAAFAAMVGTLTASPAPPGLTRVSNNGVAADVVAEREPLVRAALEKGFRVMPIKRMGAAAGTEFFRLGDSSCYATGGEDRPPHRLSDVMCSESFPSPSQPVLLSIRVDGLSSDDPGRVSFVEGVAADSVAAVAVESAGGVAASARVVANLFRLDNIPSEATHVVALDADGAAVYRVPLR